jgi:cysteine synthase
MMKSARLSVKSEKDFSQKQVYMNGQKIGFIGGSTGNLYLKAVRYGKKNKIAKDAEVVLPSEMKRYKVK